MATSFRLFEEAAAIYPQLQVTGSPDEWAKHLLILNSASKALRDEIEVFRLAGLHRTETAKGVLFLRSLCFYGEDLVNFSLQQLEQGLLNHLEHPCSNVDNEPANIGKLLDSVKDTVSKMIEATSNLLDTTEENGWHFRTSPSEPGTDDLVPTASPYQILRSMVLECDEVIDALKTKGAVNMLCKWFIEVCLTDLGCYPCTNKYNSRSVQQKKLLPGNLQEHEAYKPTGPCGRPTMMFALVPSNTALILFGTNEPSWGDLSAVADVTRQLRDFRLQHYIPKARDAFNALRCRELASRARLQVSQLRITDEKLLCESRDEAVKEMRSDTAFIGGSGNGLAMRVIGWHGNQPCYVCQGMMSYSPARVWNEKKRKSYLGSFNWDLRGDYPNSCAEADVRCQHMELDASKEGS